MRSSEVVSCIAGYVELKIQKNIILNIINFSLNIFKYILRQFK